MSTKETYKIVRAFMDETEEFYSDVTEIAEKNLKDGEVKLFPTKMVKAYKNDLTKCHKTYDKFLNVADRIDPENPDMKLIRKASEERGKLAAICEALDARNAMFTAYIGAKVASQYQGAIYLLALVVQNGELEIARVIQKVTKASMDLKKAKSQVTQAKTQRGINVAITIATSVLLPELKLAQAAMVAIGVGVARTGIDELLGPKGATQTGGIKNMATEYAGCATALGTAVNSGATVISGIDTLISDGVEVKSAEKTLKDAKKTLRDAQKRLEKLKIYAQPNGTKLRKMALALDKAQAQAASKMKAYKAAKAKRDELEKDIKQAA